MNQTGIFIAYYTLLRKDVVRILRIWKQTLLPPVITMGLYYVIFGTFIGSQVAEIEGFTYMQFIVPGLVMMAVITNSYSNVVSTFFTAKFMRNLEELLVSPTPNSVVVLGFVSGGVVRGLLVGFLVLLTSLFFTHLTLYSVFFIILVIVLTSVLFSLAGLVNGMFAKSFDAVSIIPVFVLTPLTYLGGVFYSIDALPEFWRTVSLFNPILYMVNAFRYGFLGISDTNVALSLAIIIGTIFILFGTLLYFFHRGIGLKN